ncbi:MAG: DEAD/DEAH box helicase [Candidatus Dormibacteraeota bacterium]|nr:DEAD/DEAH box helicase [Candidatus Dormibacteraeota bacterium]
MVVAPTGTGKTLVAHLTIALLAAALKNRFPRVLLIVPSRALLAQHSNDATWLPAQGIIPVHVLHPDASVAIWRTALQSNGLVLTTPVALVRRLSMIETALQLGRFDCAIFDEIDTYVTVEDQDERRDTWPAVEICLRAKLPVLGLTGTGLTNAQESKWRSEGFYLAHPAVPDAWLPMTRVRFVPVEDEGMALQDDDIRQQLSKAYGTLAATHGAVGWKQLKELARAGEPMALRILSLSFERLRLFESFGTNDTKLKALITSLQSRPVVVMTRFRDVCHSIVERVIGTGLEARAAEGSMSRAAIAEAIGWFREQEPKQKAVLVLTRELGGRGLDFPQAASMAVISPRSNYQAVAQELARIRSRRSAPKQVSILYYARTEEEAKAARLASHLRLERFDKKNLFELVDPPKPTYVLAPFESKNLRNEESVMSDFSFP